MRPTGVVMALGSSTSSSLVTTSGDTTLHTPASGKTLRLLWIYCSSSQDNSAEVFVTIRLGATSVYRAFLGAPGAFGHRETVDAGAADDELIINLDAAQSVAVNWTTTEE